MNYNGHAITEAKRKPSTEDLTMLAKGMAAEDIAKKFLIKQGLMIVETNFHSRRGELDLVMREGETLVFIEVRYRKCDIYGSAAESIDLKKQKKICHAATYFLSKHNLWDLNCRFDTVTITDSPLRLKPKLDWIQGAFENQSLP